MADIFTSSQIRLNNNLETDDKTFTWAMATKYK